MENIKQESAKLPTLEEREKAREKLNFEKFEEQLQKLIKRFSSQSLSKNYFRNPKTGNLIEQWSKFEFPSNDKTVKLGGLTEEQLRRYHRSKVHYESLRDHLYKFIKSV